MNWVFLFLAVFFIPAAASARGVELRDICEIDGKVTDVGPGEFTSTITRDNGTKKNLSVKFTELTVEVTESKLYEKVEGSKIKCNKATGKVRKYGLCENIDIVAGDIIKANTGGWPDGPECLTDVDILH